MTTGLSKDALKQIRIDMNEALQAVAKKHNLKSLHAGNVMMDSSAGCFTFKVDGVVSGGVDKFGAIYNDIRRYDSKLPPLGQIFKARNGGVESEYAIVGSNTTGSKIICAQGSKRYEWPIEAMKQILQRQGLYK